jgi:hypothetical protein
VCAPVNVNPFSRLGLSDDLRSTGGLRWTFMMLVQVWLPARGVAGSLISEGPIALLPET